MNADQKQRANELLSAWRATAYALHGDRMADLLQELADAPEAEPVLVVETEPGYWDRGHYHEGTKSYIDPTKVWGLPVGTKLYTAPPAPSVPETEPAAWVLGYYAGYLSIATVDGRVLPAGTALYLALAAPPHQSEHHLEMVNTPAPSVLDSVASEPVGYLYTNLQSGEYHVSDTDDDYRGPERVLWCIEPVYRRAKGKESKHEMETCSG